MSRSGMSPWRSFWWYRFPADEVAEAGIRGLKSPYGSASAIAPQSLMRASVVFCMAACRVRQESKGSRAHIRTCP